MTEKYLVLNYIITEVETRLKVDHHMVTLTIEINFYPLSNDHTSLNCNECHSESNYQPQCLSCHLDDFNEEHEPGDPTDCWSCHSTFDWNINLRESIIQDAH